MIFWIHWLNNLFDLLEVNDILEIIASLNCFRSMKNLFLSFFFCLVARLIKGITSHYKHYFQFCTWWSTIFLYQVHIIRGVNYYCFLSDVYILKASKETVESKQQCSMSSVFKKVANNWQYSTGRDKLLLAVHL